MREHEVPQDPSFYQGHERACYAVGKGERYVLAKSKGWEVERLATEQALLEQEAEVEAIRLRVVAGEVSPLAYHAATRQMSASLCAQYMGIAAWRVRRHFKPHVFARLAPDLRARYAHCLDMDPTQLDRVPDRPTRVVLEEENG